jgi:hypothetical protein
MGKYSYLRNSGRRLSGPMLKTDNFFQWMDSNGQGGKTIEPSTSSGQEIED